jgi:hypothetical protein
MSMLSVLGRSNCGGLEPRWSKSAPEGESDDNSSISGSIGVH